MAVCVHVCLCLCLVCVLIRVPSQVDMAPTFLGIAGLPKPATMDGHSILPLLVSSDAAAELSVPQSVAAHLSSLGDPSDYAASWRTAAFIECLLRFCTQSLHTWYIEF